MEIKKAIKEDLKREANRSLIKTESLIRLAEDNTLACTIEIDGIRVGICDNSKVIPALQFHKDEILKFMNGKKNMWE